MTWLYNDSRSTKLLDNSRDTLEEPSDFERQLGELFDKVKTMIKMGNKKDAINLLQANYEAVKEQMDAGARGIEEAAMLDIIALGYMAIGKLKRVGSLLDLVIFFFLFFARIFDIFIHINMCVTHSPWLICFGKLQLQDS